MEDQEILALYRERSEAAIAETAAKYGSYCHTVAYNILHNEEDAGECLNDTWLRAWNAIPPKQPDCLGAFLARITRNLALNRYQKQHAGKRGQGQTELALEELKDCLFLPDSVEDRIEEQLLAQSVERFLRGLPKQRRTIFIRRYWYLYSVSQIAAQYGMSENKVALLLFRMRRQLKSHFEKEGIFL